MTIHKRLPKYLVAIFILLPLAANPAQSASDRTDLSTGIVFPSDNSALVENGAALLKSRSTAELLGSFENSETNGSLSYAAGSGIIGFGLGAGRISDETRIRAGIAAGSERFALGVTALYLPDFSEGDDLSIDAGVRFQGSSQFSFAVVARNIDDGLDTIAAGVGFRDRGSIRLELDAVYSIDAESLYIDPAISIQAIQNRLSLAAGYHLPIEPSGDGTWRAGVNFWFHRNFSAEYLYRFDFDGMPGDHVFGLKVAL